MAGPIKNVVKPTNFTVQGNRGVFFPVNPVDCEGVIVDEWVVEVSSNITEEPLAEGWRYIIMENSTENYQRAIVTEWPQTRLGVYPAPGSTL